MPRQAQRSSLSRSALSSRPVSLRITISATIAVATSARPARRNQLSNSRSKVSKPTKPLEEPVNVPPE
jgi:hypothetical protein